MQKRWAFLVGINNYPSFPGEGLNWCADDVLALEELLNQAGYSVTCLHDQGKDWQDPKFPRQTTIKGELKKFCDRIRSSPNPEEEDLLLVYFACHGRRDQRGIPRLLATDSHPDELEQAIAVSDVEKIMANSGAGCRMLMLDACQIGQGDVGLTGRGTADDELLRRIHEDAKGYALLTASTSTQEAFEWTPLKHGIFAYYVLRALSGAASPRHQPYVTVNDVAGYVSRSIQELTHNLNVQQYPCQKVDNFAHFILIPEEHQAAVAGLCPPEPGEGAKSQPVAGRGGNPQLPVVKQVIDSLWTLDYKGQCQIFNKAITKITNGAVIAVQAEEDVLQLWLAKRLLRELPEPQTNLYDNCCTIHARQAVGDFDVVWRELWTWLQHQPGQEAIPYENSETVLDALVEFYGQDQNIVIVVDDWHSSVKGRRAREAQAFLQRLADEFWGPLRQRIDQKAISPLFHRLVFCLMDVKGEEGNLGRLGEMFGDVGWIDLEPFTLITPRKDDASEEYDPAEEFRDWAIRSTLKQQLDTSQIRGLLEDFSTEVSLKNSVNIISDICKACGLEHGIDDIREDWRLAG